MTTCYEGDRVRGHWSWQGKTEKRPLRKRERSRFPEGRSYLRTRQREEFPWRQQWTGGISGLPGRWQSQTLCLTHLRTQCIAESGDISRLVTLDNFSEYRLKTDGSIKNYIMLHVSRLLFILNEYLPSKLNTTSGFSIHLTTQALGCYVVKKQSIK